MLEKETFALADRALAEVIGQITDEQLEMTLPAQFETSSKKNLTIKQVLGYHAYDDAWVPAMMAGKTMEETGMDLFKEYMDGRDVRADYTDLAEQAILAVQNTEDLQQVVHCSFGDFPAQHYLWQIISFRGLRAHDLAKVTGQNTKLADELVRGMWELLSPHAEEWRSIGVFGPIVSVPEDAPLQDRLLGLTGRQPDSTYDSADNT